MQKRDGSLGVDLEDDALHLNGEVGAPASNVVDVLRDAASLSFFTIEVLNRVHLTDVSVPEAIDIAMSEQAREAATLKIEQVARSAWHRAGEPSEPDSAI